MKIKTFAVSALFIYAVAVSAQTPNTGWYTSNPSASTFEITGADQLAGLAQLVNGGNSFAGKTVTLTQDVNLSPAYAAGWVPIGVFGGLLNNKPFSGAFNGNNKKISGLYINNGSLDGAGLFGYVGGTVKNLGVEGAVAGGYNVGGVVGYLSDGGSVTGCYFAAGAVSGNGIVGGVAGSVSGGSVANCYSLGDVSGDQSVGGVAGTVSVGGTVANCYSAGAVNLGKTSGNDIGGVVGSLSLGTVVNCAALNSGVAGAAAGRVGRVIGYRAIGNPQSNNAAFSGMAVTGGTAAESVHGADMDNKTINRDGTIGGRFAGANGWTVENGKLPGLSGGAADMPAHLRVSYYTVSYSLNGGTGTAPGSVEIGPNGTILAAPPTGGYTRFGHDITANEWYKDAAGTDRFIFGAGGTAVTDDITLYLKWTINSALYAPPAGAGTSASPYVINSAAQLAFVSLMVNEGHSVYGSASAHYRLGGGIDISGYGAAYNGSRGWVPAGTASHPFKGVFDGDQKEIAGLYINNNTLDNAGLFGYVFGEVKKVSVAGTVTARNNVGGVAGYVGGAGSVTRSHFNGAVSGSGNAGGVAGSVTVGAVTNCHSGGTVAGGGNIGGVVGYAGRIGSVERCYSISAVEGTGGGSAGGVVGYAGADAYRVIDCAALGPGVKGGTGAAGRVVGAVESGSGVMMADNAAFVGLLNRSDNTEWDNKGSDAKDGADITAFSINRDGSIGGRFTKGFGWEPENGKLPGIAAAVVMPPHLQIPDAAPVVFGVSGTGGTLGAKIDGAAITSGHGLEADREVVFTAAPGPGFILKSWTVKIGGDTVIMEEYGTLAGNVYTLNSGISKDVEVSVAFGGDLAALAGIEFAAAGPVYYSGSAVDTTVYIQIKTSGVPLKEGRDYSLVFRRGSAVTADFVSAGTITAAVSGIGSYEGALSGTLTIAPKQLSGLMAVVADGPYAYTGEAIMPGVTVTDPDRSVTLAPGADYAVSYKNNKNFGLATVTIEGRGNYTGESGGSFLIEKSKVIVEQGTYRISKEYDGGGTPGIGSGDLLVTGIMDENVKVIATPGSYPGSSMGTAYSVTVALSLTSDANHQLANSSLTINDAVITGISIANAVVEVGGTYNYDGSPHTPSISNVTVKLNGVTLTPGGAHYEFSASDNINAGINTATVTVTGAGSYSGTAAGKFTINPKQLTSGMVTVVSSGYTYSGSEITPDVTVRDPGRGNALLVSGTDYDVECSNNINAGTAAATAAIKGKGNYSGTAGGFYFSIGKAQVTAAQGEYRITKVYDGKTEAGAGSGDLSVTGLAGSGVSVNAVPGPYPDANAGTAYSVTVTLSLSNGANHSLTSTTLTVTGAAITPRGISGAEVDILGAYTYNGEKQALAGSNVIVYLDGMGTLAGGLDYIYEVTGGGTNAGAATVTVTGKGNYGGTETGTFTIAKAAGSGSVTVSGWIAGETANHPVPSSATNGIAGVTYHYKARDANEAAYSTAVPATAGDYTVRATFAATENYSECEASADFTIAPSVSVLSPDRVVPRDNRDADAAIAVPPAQLSAEFTAGPNPVSKFIGRVGFFRQGRRVDNAVLTIYDASGNFISKVRITDKTLGGQASRLVGSWDLRDDKGRMVGEGTYVVKGVLKLGDGKAEKVSLVLGVR